MVAIAATITVTIKGRAGRGDRTGTATSSQTIRHERARR